ncbi:hypothetical protein [Robertmurraya siralis]|uniref:hypothetical protein n=1 Tax=Robertmurraya siralis TaxID=77777 RepID=UPI00147685DD|nr:hypothetical protein [Robertmurraya siralis]
MIIVELDKYRMNKQYEDYYKGLSCSDVLNKKKLNTYDKELVAGYMKLLTSQIKTKEV